MKWLAAILLFAGCASLPESENADPAAEVWSSYADGVDDAEVSVALVRDGVPAFAGNPRAIYRLGSLTDFFILESARRLEDRGAIDLDRPMTAFARFPLDPLYGRFSMRDLMELRADRIGSDRSLGFLADRFPWTSDGRIALFAALLENAVGKSVEEIVRDEVVLPLQLKDTTFTPSADKLPRLVTRGDGLGGLYSSVEDCVKFFASSERVRSPFLLKRRRGGDDAFSYAVGHVRGCRRFFASPADGRDFLLIFRNVTSWSPYRDFKFASRLLTR